MNRENDFDIFETIDYFHDASTNIEYRLAKILAPVGCHYNQTSALFAEPLKLRIRKFIFWFYYLKQGIYDGVASNEYPFVIYSLVSKAFPGSDCRQEMDICQLRYHGTVDFLGKGFVLVIRTQTRFHMADWRFLVEGGKTSCEGRSLSLIHISE